MCAQSGLSKGKSPGPLKALTSLSLPSVIVQHVVRLLFQLSLWGVSVINLSFCFKDLACPWNMNGMDNNWDT